MALILVFTTFSRLLHAGWSEQCTSGLCTSTRHLVWSLVSTQEPFLDFISVIPLVGFLLHGSAGPLTARLGGAVLLPCFVDRPLPLEELEVDWRRTDSDTIVHLFQDGQSRPESQGDAYRDRAQLFPQEIPKGNFSLLLEEVRAADAGVYKCVVYTEQEQRETRVEIQEIRSCVNVPSPGEGLEPQGGPYVLIVSLLYCFVCFK
uniref:Ig-like domain-containing protein n=1 Tax=Paramormyrops kingsleyae TaxID=1676925 RepID=A0A3B3Q7L5_9TELE